MSAAETILGIDHAPLVGKRIQEAFPGLTGTPVRDRYRAAGRDGGVWHVIESPDALEVPGPDRQRPTPAP